MCSSNSQSFRDPVPTLRAELSVPYLVQVAGDVRAPQNLPCCPDTGIGRKGRGLQEAGSRASTLFLFSTC